MEILGQLVSISRALFFTRTNRQLRSNPFQIYISLIFFMTPCVITRAMLSLSLRSWARHGGAYCPSEMQRRSTQMLKNKRCCHCSRPYLRKRYTRLDFTWNEWVDVSAPPIGYARSFFFPSGRQESFSGGRRESTWRTQDRALFCAEKNQMYRLHFHASFRELWSVRKGGFLVYSG